MLDLDAQLGALDAAMLTPVVRKALDRDEAIAGEWTYTPLAHGVINPVTAGLYRFSGTGRDGEEPLPWSAILKVVRSHLDTHCVNLFARIGDQGQEETVVIGWSFLGIAASDLSPLVPSHRCLRA